MSSKKQIQQRFRTALELFEAGVDLKRQNLRREYPGETEEQIESRLNEWLTHPPGAEHGDCPGPQYRRHHIFVKDVD